MDGKSLMKIWNLNKLTGIIGVFNCQGAGNWPLKEVAENRHCTNSSISGLVRPIHVELLEKITGENWDGDSAVYCFNSGFLHVVPKNGSLEVSLRTLQFEVYTVSPIQVFGHGLRFAPIGLLGMYNSGGAVESLSCYEEASSGNCVKIRGRGLGRFGAYSSLEPKRCSVTRNEEPFTYNPDNGLLVVYIQGDSCDPKDIEFTY